MLFKRCLSLSILSFCYKQTSPSMYLCTPSGNPALSLRFGLFILNNFSYPLFVYEKKAFSLNAGKQSGELFSRSKSLRDESELQRRLNPFPYCLQGRSRSASALLVHPNAAHFGAGRRTNCRKTVHRTVFLRQLPPRGSSP